MPATRTKRPGATADPAAQILALLSKMQAEIRTRQDVPFYKEVAHEALEIARWALTLNDRVILELETVQQAKARGRRVRGKARKADALKRRRKVSTLATRLLKLHNPHALAGIIARKLKGSAGTIRNDLRILGILPQRKQTIPS
jgi:hypothetical protein